MESEVGFMDSRNLFYAHRILKRAWLEKEDFVLRRYQLFGSQNFSFGRMSNYLFS